MKWKSVQRTRKNKCNSLDQTTYRSLWSTFAIFWLHFVSSSAPNDNLFHFPIICILPCTVCDNNNNWWTCIRSALSVSKLISTIDVLTTYIIVRTVIASLFLCSSMEKLFILKSKFPIVWIDWKHFAVHSVFVSDIFVSERTAMHDTKPFFFFVFSCFTFYYTFNFKAILGYFALKSGNIEN